jgi:hypothetical protein
MSRPAEDWKGDGLCRQVDPELFYPEPTRRPLIRQKGCARPGRREDHPQVGLRHDDPHRQRWCRVSINDIERHQLKLLRAELGLDPPPASAERKTTRRTKAAAA